MTRSRLRRTLADFTDTNPASKDVAELAVQPFAIAPVLSDEVFLRACLIESHSKVGYRHNRIQDCPKPSGGHGALESRKVSQ